MAMPGGKGAWTATVGAKGQIVIPKEARDMFGIKPGDTLVILGDIERGLAIPPKEQCLRVRAARDEGPLVLHPSLRSHQSHD